MWFSGFSFCHNWIQQRNLSVQWIAYLILGYLHVLELEKINMNDSLIEPTGFLWTKKSDTQFKPSHMIIQLTQRRYFTYFKHFQTVSPKCIFLIDKNIPLSPKVLNTYKCMWLSLLYLWVYFCNRIVLTSL